ncbi:PAS domain S-box protein [Niallia sp. JL1B1071]|uniref:PAS domain S-box protein n=1 Tax=Niallia tiangongensis TaxID=3237105 RepID=UPI0037DC9B24
MKRFLEKIGQDIFAFTGIFDSIIDLIFFMEVEEDSFRYVYVNQTALRILNMKENIIGSRIEEALPLDRTKILIAKYRQVLSTKHPLNFIEMIETDNGEFVGETTLSPIFTVDGQCKYVLAIVRDITERMQKERELKETKRELERNQKRLISLVENNGDAVFELDLQGDFINLNKVFTELTGFKESELLGKSFLPLIVEEFVEAASIYFKNTLNGRKEEYETWIHKSNGQKMLLNVKNVPITVDGEIVGVYGIAKDITESKKLEHLLKENEQKYKSLFEQHPDAIFTYDVNGNFTSGNAGVEKISGYSKDEFLGKSFIPMMVPEDVEKTLYHFNKAITEKKAVSYEVALQHKNDHRVELLVMSIPIIVDNQVTGVYGIAKDVTEIKFAQEALVKTIEELNVFWKYTVDPVYFINTFGEIQKVNPAFEKMFGYLEKEIVGKKYVIVPSGYIEKADEVIRKIGNGEFIASHETKRVTKSGEILDFLSTYTPVKDDQGKVIGATVFYKDITDRMKSERKLQESEEKYRLITENAFDIIKLINPLGIVEYVSPSNKQILGYTSSEYVGKRFTSYIHPDDISRLEKGFENILKGKSPSPVEIRVLHKDGHWIWLEVTTTPVMEEGEIKKFVSISRDITERKKIRDELSKMAFYDYLSGLPNRRTFDDRLEMAIHQANRSKKKVVVMMLDGRKFKQINDTFGHDAGDAVIVEMGKRLQQCVRKTDTVARLGGDELGIILPELHSIDVAEKIAIRIINSFDEPFYYNEFEIKMGAGIGIAVYPDHSANKKQLIKYADEALYEAKESEQNEYRIKDQV